MTRRSSRHLFWLLIILTMVVLVVFDSLVRFYISYEDSLSTAKNRAIKTNDVLMRDIENLTSIVDIALRRVQSVILLEKRVPWNADLVQLQLNSWQSLWSEVPYVHSVMVIDPLDKRIPGMSDEMNALLREPIVRYVDMVLHSDTDSRNFYLSKQVILPDDGDYVVWMGRRLLDNDGNLIGILTAVIRLEYFYGNYLNMGALQDGYDIMVSRPGGERLWSYPLVPDLDQVEGFPKEGGLDVSEMGRSEFLVISIPRTESLFILENRIDPGIIYQQFYGELKKHTLMLTLVFPVVFVLGILLYRRMKLSEDLNISLNEKMSEIELQALALRKGEEKFRNLLHSVKDGILAFEKSGRILFSNQGATDVFQATSEEMANRTLFDFIATEETAAHLRKDLENFPDIALASHELMGKRLSGEAFPMEYSLALLDGGENQLFVAVFRDVSARVETMQQLRLLSKAVETISQGIVITSEEDEDYPILYANRAFLRMTGYRLDEVIGKNPRFLQGSRTDRMMVSLLRTALRNKEPITLELINYRKSGYAFHNQLSIAPIRDDKGRVTHFVGVTSDVSQMNDLREQFLQSQKMEAIGKLAGGVAHDFNNLLTVINGYAQLGMSESGEHLPVLQYFQGILEASKHASSMTRQLLTLSKRQNLQTQMLDLNRLLEGMRSMLQRLMGEHYQLLLETEPGALIVEGDPGQLEQVILNLAINARDAMPNGGVLSLCTLSFPEETLVKDGIVLPGSLRAGDYVCIVCRDNGVGMDEATRQRIFEPFFSTKSSAEHNGLGLSTSFGIVQHSKGVIQVDSDPGKGSTFRIFLPWHRRAQIVNEVAPVSMEIKQLNQRNILLVEDNAEVLRITRLFLEGAGAHVCAVNNGLQALEALKGSEQKPFDLLITDVLMPEMGGKELADAYLDIYPQGRVIFISGFTDEIFNWSRQSDDRCMFLMKPFEKNQLFQCISSILAK
jgi:two-component system cell cycle sensor histidine kinase/response regulator CckA